MTSQTRFNRIGLAGRKSAKNVKDPFVQTIEAPIVAVASAAQQDTGIPLPDGGIQEISAFIKVDSPEVTGTTKTVNVGVFGGSATAFLSAADVSTVGVTGETLISAVNTSDDTIGYTLGSANFAELEGTLVLTIIALGNP